MPPVVKSIVRSPWTLALPRFAWGTCRFIFWFHVLGVMMVFWWIVFPAIMLYDWRERRRKEKGAGDSGSPAPS